MFRVCFSQLKPLQHIPSLVCRSSFTSTEKKKQDKYKKNSLLSILDLSKWPRILIFENYRQCLCSCSNNCENLWWASLRTFFVSIISCSNNWAYYQNIQLLLKLYVYQVMTFQTLQETFWKNFKTRFSILHRGVVQYFVDNLWPIIWAKNNQIHGRPVDAQVAQNVATI